MIHVVTNKPELFPDRSLYDIVPLQEAIEYNEKLEEIALDSETTGFDPHIDKLLTLQIGDPEHQYVIDCGSVDIKVLKPLLESKVILGQNLKFDLKFLYKHGIYPRKIFDTFVVERVLFCGIPEHRAALDALAFEYLGISLDKSIRADIHKEGLTSRVIKYAADDIIHLAAIKAGQVEALKKKDLIGTSNLENRFTPVLSYIEYCGFKLDADKWLEKMDKDSAKLKLALDKLNKWVVDRELRGFINPPEDLFTPASCKVNWGSPKQVTALMESLGVNCTIIDHGKEKKTVEAPILMKQGKITELIPIYLDYKKQEKVNSTYGENFLDQINPVTGRLHTQFRQILNTGRISSGGSNKDSGESYINFQNIPKDKETRGSFVAEPGNTLIIADYSGQEQIILANFSMDAGLLDFYDKGFEDMHSFIASKMYPKLSGLSLKEIKEQYPDERYIAKTVGFAIVYGGNGSTIADNIGISEEEGNVIYNAYFIAFPGLKVYFQNNQKQGLRDGFILISPLTRRKSYVPFFDKYKELEAQMTQEFWEDYRYAKSKNTPEFKYLRKKVSEYFMFKGDIERMTLNFPTQGSAAEITKISAILIYDYIIENNLFGIAKFVNQVHDENVLECPLDVAEELSDVVKDRMVKAGELFCKRVPLKVEPELSTIWKK